MSAPRTKRQFAGAASDPAQRQITSFFAGSNTNSNNSSGRGRPGHSSTNTTTRRGTEVGASPSLPDAVQANLINVGMRVRKSVPEGYKTGSYSAFALWDEGDTPIAAAAASYAASAAGTTAIPPAASTASMAVGEFGQRLRANAVSTPRTELLPFCGIHKVGGLDLGAQLLFGGGYPAAPFPAYSPPTPVIDDDDDDDIPPGLITGSSQGDSSAASSSPPNRKRSFAEDDDDENADDRRPRGGLDVVFHDDDGGGGGDISPHSLAPVGWGRAGSQRHRVMAVPRKGRLLRGSKAMAAPPPPAVAGVDDPGQENVMMVDGSDFGEADFLDRRAWEVDMSDA
ncbi:hypothetical protein GGR56DRAFT_449017 [Xylariaceae sp. FL0804]|nr:hypothetical protein GGR56DRAFT_449017 [Xylariaceae sp. FL0804]